MNKKDQTKKKKNIKEEKEKKGVKKVKYDSEDDD